MASPVAACGCAIAELDASRATSCVCSRFARAVQQYTAMIRVEVKFPANFGDVHVEQFAHGKHANGGFGQGVQAPVEQCPELLTGDECLGARPGARARVIVPMTTLVEKLAIEHGVLIGVALERRGVDRAASRSHGIDQLVAQNREDPSLASGAPGEFARWRARRRQCFLNGVFCRMFVAQLQSGKAQQVATQFCEIRVVQI